MEINWHLKPWAELTTEELYSILALRAEVFVVEQNCPYQDLDGLDQNALQLFAISERKTVATARIIPPDEQGSHIGRVCTAPAFRGSGLGKALMKKALEAADKHFPQVPVKIAAQQYLEKFYMSFGFQCLGDSYLWDGILHIDMLRKAPSTEP